VSKKTLKQGCLQSAPDHAASCHTSDAVKPPRDLGTAVCVECDLGTAVCVECDLATAVTALSP